MATPVQRIASWRRHVARHVNSVAMKTIRVDEMACIVVASRRGSLTARSILQALKGIAYFNVLMYKSVLLTGWHENITVHFVNKQPAHPCATLLLPVKNYWKYLQIMTNRYGRICLGGENSNCEDELQRTVVWSNEGIFVDLMYPALLFHHLYPVTWLE